MELHEPEIYINKHQSLKNTDLYQQCSSYFAITDFSTNKLKNYQSSNDNENSQKYLKYKMQMGSNSFPIRTQISSHPGSIK